MSQSTTRNQRQTIQVIDSVTKVPFIVQGNSSTGSINVAITSGGGGGTQYSSGTTTPSPVIGNALIYDNGGTLQNVSVANPLPVSATISTAGLATSANQTNKSQITQIADASGNIISSTSNALNVSIANSTIAITASSLPLPTGAATSANQSTEITSLSTIATNTTGVSTAANQATMNSNLTTIATNTAAGATSANQINGNQQSKITDGTNIANIVPGDTGFNGLVTASATRTIPFTTSTAGAQTVVPSTNVEGYSKIIVVYTSVGVGLALNGQWSNASAGTYFTAIGFGGDAITPTNLGVIVGIAYYSAIQGNYFQIAVSALTSGTLSGYIILTNDNFVPNKISVTALQSGSWTMQGSNTNSGLSFTASAQSITIANRAAYNNLVPFSVNGTYSGLSFTVSVSDNNGVNYYPAWVFTQSTGVWQYNPTITPGTNASVLYYVTVPPNSTGSLIKLTSTAFTSGTASVIGGGSNVPNSIMAPSQIMDSAGNARGANVDGNNNLNVSLGGTGALPALSTGTNAIGTVGTTPAVINVGQQTSNTSAVQLSSTSTVPTNGIVVEALAGNSAVVYVGGSGVTTSTGFQLSAGQSISFTCNLNTLYVIGSNNTDKICWTVE